MNVKSFYRFYIDVVVSSQGVLPWRFKGMYGDPMSSQHFNTWELIKCLCVASSRPWLCGRNFNKVLEVCEKSGAEIKARGILMIFEEH